MTATPAPTSRKTMSVVTGEDAAPRVIGKPRVVVTRRLLAANHARMAELFDVVLNEQDTAMSRERGRKTTLRTVRLVVVVQ